MTRDTGHRCAPTTRHVRPPFWVDRGAFNLSGQMASLIAYIFGAVGLQTVMRHGGANSDNRHVQQRTKAARGCGFV